MILKKLIGCLTMERKNAAAMYEVTEYSSAREDRCLSLASEPV